MNHDRTSSTANVRRIRKTDWAEDDGDDDETGLSLPPPQSTKNKDGTETVVSYRLDDQGRKVKTTRRIKKVTVKHAVNPRVAERRGWAKFGDEKGKPAGPSTDTVSVGEVINFRPSVNWKASQQEEKSAIEQKKAAMKDTKIKCRICGGDHWTSKCPYKDTMAPEGEPGPGLLPADEEEGGPGGLGAASGSYVPPHLRGKGGAGERMGGGKYGDRERDDLATVRVTNISEYAEESEIRELFGRVGHINRVFLAKDRETGRAKGFAFISYGDRSDAQRACDMMDGCKSSRLDYFRANCDSWLSPLDSAC
jgi:translation initiation factor 3 subunit G